MVLYGIMGLVFIVLTVYCITLLFPLIWMMYASLNDEIGYTLSPLGLPKKLEFSNFSKVISVLKVTVMKNGMITDVRIGGLFINSILWAFVNAAFGVLIQAHVAFVMAKYKFFGRRFLYNLGIFIMMVPIVGNLPSALLLR